MGVAQKHIYNVQKPPKTLKAQYYKEMYIFKGCRVPLNQAKLIYLTKIYAVGQPAYTLQYCIITSVSCRSIVCFYHI